jgi:hypothetical protein
MAARDDEDPPWVRQLLVSLAVLALVALLVGGVVSVVALGAAKVAGVDSAGETASARPSLYIPSGRPTVGLEQYPTPSGASTSSRTSPTPSASASPTKKRKKEPAISLQAFPGAVAANERINLTGRYRGGAGVRLQVQRLEAGRWTPFPVTVTVNGGQFATYILTSRSGVQRFRVADPAAGETSNAVRVTVG